MPSVVEYDTSIVKDACCFWVFETMLMIVILLNCLLCGFVTCEDLQYMGINGVIILVLFLILGLVRILAFVRYSSIKVFDATKRLAAARCIHRTAKAGMVFSLALFIDAIVLLSLLPPPPPPEGDFVPRDVLFPNKFFLWVFLVGDLVYLLSAFMPICFRESLGVRQPVNFP